MKNVAFVLFALLLSHCAALPTAQTQAISPSPRLTYIFEPVLLDDHHRAVNVELIFKGSPSGTTTLQIPRSWGGHHNLDQNIFSLKTLSHNTRLLQQNGNTIVTHPPNTVVHMSYHIRQNKQDSLYQNRNYYKPILKNDYLHLIGETFLIHPEGDAKNEITVTLVWKNLPEAWALIHSYGANAHKTRVKTTLARLKNGVFIAGAVKIFKQIVQGKPLYFVFRGSWGFSPEKFMHTATRILETQRAFWNDHDFDFFLVSLAPIGAACCHAGGLNLHHAVSLFLPDNQKLTAELKHLAAHELFHTWNGQKIQRAHPQESLFWFSEGFTNYFARLLNLKSGVISPAEYAEELNRVIFDYYSLPAEGPQNSVLGHEFWKNNEVAKIPYVKGEMMAQYLDHLIRKKTPGSSLADVMKDLLRHVQANGTKVTESHIRAAFSHIVPSLTWPGPNAPLALAPHPDSCMRLAEKTFKMKLFGKGHWAAASTYQKNLVGASAVKIPQYEIITDCNANQHNAP